MHVAAFSGNVQGQMCSGPNIEALGLWRSNVVDGLILAATIWLSRLLTCLMEACDSCANVAITTINSSSAV